MTRQLLHNTTDGAIDQYKPRPGIDLDYLTGLLRELLAIPSPTGYTDAIVRYVGKELKSLGIDFELTRRGAIRATLPGQTSKPNRAVVAHVDTLGAMVTRLKPNGRLACRPIGTWSSRFAEGCRVSVFHDAGHSRGSLIPLKASGHVYADEIDTQPVNWDQLEVRLDEFSRDEEELFNNGFRVGDYIAVDPQPEFTDNGYIISRHLDDKAGVSCLLAAAKYVLEHNETQPLPIDCHLLFTISEEVGSGASTVLHRDCAELVAIDNATNAPEQNSSEYDVTVTMMDASGPFDYHLTQRLLKLAREHGILHGRDVFRHYRCDAASAVEAGNDIRTALLCFGVDSSHGYERTHTDSLACVAQLVACYMQSPAVVPRDADQMGPLKGFPKQQHIQQPPEPREHHSKKIDRRTASPRSEATPPGDNGDEALEYV